jgi:hypothetical protein
LDVSEPYLVTGAAADAVMDAVLLAMPPQEGVRMGGLFVLAILANETDGQAETLCVLAWPPDRVGDLMDAVASMPYPPGVE